MGTLPDNDDLKRLAPTLASLPKADPFVVPEGFFEHFPHRVQARVTAARPAPGLTPWVMRLAFALPVAAALAGSWWMLRGDDAAVRPVAVMIPTASVDELELLDSPEEFAALVEDGEATPELTASGVDLNEDELAVWLECERTDPAELIAEL